MKAIRYDRYGSPDVLKFEDIEVPAVGDDDVLIRVRAASVNPLDWHFMRGAPYLVRLAAGLSRPRAGRLGADMAGADLRRAPEAALPGGSDQGPEDQAVGLLQA